MDRRSLFAATAVVFLSACAGRPYVIPTLPGLLSLRPVSDRVVIEMLPPIGQQATASVGAQMVRAMEARWRDGYLMSNIPPVSWVASADYVLSVDPPKGWVRVAYLGTDQSEYSEEVRLTVRGTFKGKPYDENVMLGSYRIVPSGDVELLLRWDEDSDILRKPLPGATFQRSEQRGPGSEKRFQRELVYTGRSGGSISLLYREYTDNLARPAFSQQLQYDIEKDSVVGFQGARIKILAANNTEVSYEVLSAMTPP